MLSQINADLTSWAGTDRPAIGPKTDVTASRLLSPHSINHHSGTRNGTTAPIRHWAGGAGPAASGAQATGVNETGRGIVSLLLGALSPVNHKGFYRYIYIYISGLKNCLLVGALSPVSHKGFYRYIYIRAEGLFVSWCFEPSKPQRILYIYQG